MKINDFVELAKKGSKGIGNLAQSAISKFREWLVPSIPYIDGKDFSALWRQEWTRYVMSRWKRPLPDDLPADSVVEPATKLNLVGLALSGGGIRSATFNLGLLQALARLKLLKYVDYLSTVSGGGYIGSCLTSHLHHQKDSELEGEKFPFGFPQPGKEGSGEERREVRHLRNHSSYLAPRRGLFSVYTWRMVGTYLGSLVLLFPIPLAALIVLAAIIDALSWTLGGPFWKPPFWNWDPFLRCPTGNWLCLVSVEWAPPGLARSLLLFALVMLVLFLISVSIFLVFMKGGSQPERRNLLADFQSCTLLLMVVSIFVAVFPFAVDLWSPRYWEDRLALPKVGWVAEKSKEWVEVGKWVVSLLSVLGILGANRDWQKEWLKAIKLPLIKGGVVVFLISFWLTLLDIYRTYPNEAVWVSIVILALCWNFLDPDRVSLHQFYRDRLTEAFVVRRSGDRFDPDHNLKLADLCGRVTKDAKEEKEEKNPKQRKFFPPYPLINAAINLTGDQDADLRDRRAHLFQFSPFFCGSEKTGWRATQHYESGRIDLATAMAISGAAVGSQMGMYTNRPLAMLLTLLNIRLGSWRQNPAIPSVARRGGMFLTLFREMLGMTNSGSAYVNLSDGGHFENLGLYGLIQRRCKFIVVSDSGADQTFAFTDLGNALRKIRIDLGVQIELDLTMLKPDPHTGLSPWHCAVGEIQYPEEKEWKEEKGKEEKGILVYLKPTLSGDEPADLLTYRREHKTFPHEATSDQFFDEAQFEAYRALGYRIGKEVFAPVGDLLKKLGRNVVEEAFKRLLIHWQQPAPGTGESFHSSAAQVMELERLLKADPALRRYDMEVYPVLKRVWGGKKAKVPVRDRGREFHFVCMQIQLMENVWMALDLYSTWDHPDNIGWYNLFRRWVKTPTFQRYWKIVRGTYGPDFQMFVEKQLLPPR